MNIVTILSKLKEKEIIADNEESLNLFSDSFNKFGISLLLLKNEDKFNQILSILEEHKIPLQKANGMFALRIFAVETDILKDTINEYFVVDELAFLRLYPELLAELSTVRTIVENMKKYQKENIPYKENDVYNIPWLLNYEDKVEQIEEVKEVEIQDVNSYLKSILKDASLLEKLANQVASTEEEDFNVALELQKVENKICEEYLLPVDDGWKIVINDKEVNSFQEVKNTINTIINLNLSISFDDALLIVLLYKTPLSVEEVKDIVETVINKGGEQ